MKFFGEIVFQLKDEVSGYKCSNMGSWALHLEGQIGAEANLFFPRCWLA